MKWIKMCTFFLVFTFPIRIEANECCNFHNGNSNTCSVDGKVVCNDGFVCEDQTCMITNKIPTEESKTEDLEPEEKVYGCMDKSAKNYNANANINDYSCTYYTYGCTNKDAFNYNENAEKDDGTCIPKIYGCTKENAINYNKDANTNDQSCMYELIKEMDREIPYETKIMKDKSLYLYEEEIIQKGIEGREKLKYQILFDENGNEIKNKEIEKTVLRQMQPKIIKIGTQKSTQNILWFLYRINIFFLLFLIFYTKGHKTIYREIITNDYSSKPILSIFSKCCLLLFYFVFILPVFIDIFLIIKNEIEKRV